MWFNAEEDNFRARILSKPYNNIHVGSSPLDGMTLETARSYHTFINLCENPLYSLDDERPNLETAYHWIPIEELEEWGEEKISRVRDILDFEYNNSHKIYMHCAAGTNRSPCIAMNWLMFSRKHSLKDAALIVAGNGAEIFERKYKMNIELGYIVRKI
jgi:protein-tyrosine phosphatase